LSKNWRYRFIASRNFYKNPLIIETGILLVMTSMNKRVALLLIAMLAVSSLIVVKTAPASASISKPSVPEFTAKFVDRSYDVPTTSSIDPYTGQTVTHPAHRVENYTIDLPIKNQPYTPTVVQEGTSNWTTSFHYDVHMKGHYAQNWTILYAMGEGPTMSNSDFTVITYLLSISPSQPDQGYSLVSYDPSLDTNTITGIPPNSQIDFQVRALVGAVHRGYNANATNQLDMFPWVFDGEISDWSNAQTITIPTSTPSSTGSPSPASTPDQTTEPTPNETSQTLQLETIIGAVIAVVVVSAVSLVYFKKRKH